VTDDLETPPLSYALTRLARQLSKSMADVRIEELTGAQLIALLTLEQEPGLSNAQLARRCFVSPQAMSAVVLDLEYRGYLTRDPNPSNQRILRAHVTAAGIALIQTAEARIRDLERQLVKGFTVKEARQFRAAVARAAQNLGLPSADNDREAM
jgi:DNA-binding MarR family transcriptional regulator